MEHGVAKAKRIVASCNTATAKSEQDTGNKCGSKNQSSMKVGGLKAKPNGNPLFKKLPLNI